MGELIASAYPVEGDYDVDDKRHMFDDGLSGDEEEDALSEHETIESDTSSNYEELTEGVRNASSSEEDGDEDEDEVEVDNSGISSEEGEVKAADSSITSGSEYDDDTSTNTADPTSTPTKPPPSPAKVTPSKILLFKDLRKAEGLLKIQAEGCDILHWKVKELHEMIREIERQLPGAEEILEIAQQVHEYSKEDFKKEVLGSGLSVELYQAFNDFCESLHPKYGLREGFSVELEGKHKGTYIEYDPSFKVFKDCVEMDYKTCNFRCEATKEVAWSKQDAAEKEFDIVTFFPVRSPEPGAGPNTTWGMQYVSSTLLGYFLS